MREFLSYLVMPYLWQGMLIAIEITVISMALALGLGLALALMRQSRNAVLRTAALLYIWFIRGTPILLQLVFLYTALPTLGIGLDSVQTAVLGFTLNESAFAAEIIRGGIRSVNRTQLIAAQSLGMGTVLTLRKIVLPQALRAILPALGNDAISMLKLTSLGSVIAVNELMLRSQNIVAQNFLFFQVYCASGLMYLLATTLMSFGQSLLEQKLKLGDEPAESAEEPFAARVLRLASGRRAPKIEFQDEPPPPPPVNLGAKSSSGLARFLADLGASGHHPTDDAFVDCRGVSKNYGGKQVLCGVDLKVGKGEVVVLIGPSGSGKSTLLRMINHLETMDGGEVLVGGEHVGYQNDDGALRPVRDLARARATARIGMVFQHFNLFDHLPVAENVSIAPVYVFGMPQADADRVAADLLTDVGLGNHLRHLPHRLSGGQQQRVAIVRALAIAPRLMLFDEPTSALDPELVDEVLQLMRRLAEAGMTMIVVTHEIRFARAVADRIVFMAEGRVVEEGPPEQILTAPREERTRRFLRHLIPNEGEADESEPRDGARALSSAPP